MAQIAGGAGLTFIIKTWTFPEEVETYWEIEFLDSTLSMSINFKCYFSYLKLKESDDMVSEPSKVDGTNM